MYQRRKEVFAPLEKTAIKVQGGYRRIALLQIWGRSV
jgi:hypothetical protein